MTQDLRMMQYLVDTDWTIEYMRRREPVASRLMELFPYGLGISIISLAEIYEGILGTDEPQDDERILREFLDGVAIVHLDDVTCRIFARERSYLRASGTLIGDLDILIGSTALRHSLTLLTNNRRHFERLQGLSIISV